jgi:hypothetical protein
MMPGPDERMRRIVEEAMAPPKVPWEPPSTDILADLKRWNAQISDMVYRAAPIKRIFTTWDRIPGGWTYVYRTDGWRDFYVHRQILLDGVQPYGGTPLLSFYDAVSDTTRMTTIPVYHLD